MGSVKASARQEFLKVKYVPLMLAVSMPQRTHGVRRPKLSLRDRQSMSPPVNHRDWRISIAASMRSNVRGRVGQYRTACRRFSEFEPRWVVVTESSEMPPGAKRRWQWVRRVQPKDSRIKLISLCIAINLGERSPANPEPKMKSLMTPALMRRLIASRLTNLPRLAFSSIFFIADP